MLTTIQFPLPSPPTEREERASEKTIAIFATLTASARGAQLQDLPKT